MANLGPDFIVNSTTADNQFAPSITTLADGRFVAVWESADPNIDGDGSCILMQIYNSDGSLSGNETLVNNPTIPNNQSRPVVAALQGGGFVIAWECELGDGLGSSIQARIYDSAGNPAGPFEDEFFVNSDPVGDQTRPAIAALDDGGFVIAWTTPDVDGTGIKARLFSADGTPVDNAVNGNTNDFVVNNLTTTDAQTEVSVTATDDGFLVTWFSNEVEPTGLGAPGAIRGRAFDFGGEPVDFGGAILDNDYIINSTIDSAQFEPASTRLADGRILVTWTSFDAAGDGDPYCIRGRILAPDGSFFASPEGDDFVINSTAAGSQMESTVAALPNGGFVVAWTSSDGGDGSGQCIRARMFNSSGVAVGNDFIANFEATNAQVQPSVTALPDGRFVITWTSDDSGQGDIRAAIFNADGNGVTVAATGNGDILNGTVGDDTLNGGKGSDTLNGLAGSDTLFGGGSDDVLNGDSGDDFLIGGAGDDKLNAGDGNDQLDGGAGGDVIDGGDQLEDGADTVLYYQNAVGIYLNLGLTNTDFNASGGDASFDKISNVENVVGTEFNDILIGDDGDNEIHALAGADTIDGGAGDDKIMGGAGADTIDGGAGFDGVNYLFSATGVTLTLGVNGAQAAVSGAGSDGLGDKVSNVEIVQGSQFGADSLTGNELNNWLFGEGGNDTLKGGNGDDLLSPGSGVDVVDGGAGNDTVNYDNGTTTGVTGVTITLGVNGTATGFAAAGGAVGDKLTLIENVVGTDDLTNGDVITGNALDNIINGMSGPDVLSGGGGNDTLSYEFSNPSVTVNLGTNVFEGGHAEGDSVAGFRNVIGGRDHDKITGDGGDNVIEGREGGDTLSGSGNGAVGDTVSYAGADGAVTIVLNTSASGSHAAGDIISNFENVLGSAFDDELLGDDFGNKLTGGAGNDRLIGGEGDDILDGGAGARDLVSFSGGLVGITLTLGASGAAAFTGTTGVGPGKDTISNIEDIVGSDVVDKLSGNNLGNIIEGGKGGDVLDGGAVNDGDTLSYANSNAAVNVTLSLAAFGAASTGGDAAGDTNKNFENLRGSLNNDTLTGNTGNNIIEGGVGGDTLNGGAGVDTLSYEHGSVEGVEVELDATGTIGGGDGDAQGDTGGGFENLIGSIFNDDLISNHTTVATVIDGRGGDDTISGTDVAAGDTLTGGDGEDSISGNGGTDKLFGGAGNDGLQGNAGNDTIDGGTGNDWIVGGAGGDNMDGGAGMDRVEFGGSGNLTINLALNTISGVGGSEATGDTIKNFEHVRTNISGNATITGTAGYNELQGGAGDDTIEGGGAGDLLDGDAGSNDTLSYKNSTVGVVVDTIQEKGFAGDADGDKFDNFENFWLSAKDDFITDDINAVNSIDGGAGTDTISYRDQPNGGVNIDLTKQYTVNAAGVFSGGTPQGGAFDKLANFENIIGSKHNDSLTGDTKNNVIEGGLGADVLDGGAHVTGGDTLSYASSNSAVLVTLNLATFDTKGAGGHAADDDNKNFENLVGSEFGDSLTGNSAANIIRAGDGDDLVDGGAAADFLDGGVGIDTLSFAGSTAVAVDLSKQSIVDVAGNFVGGVVGTGGNALNDKYARFENIIGTGGDDKFIGSAAANKIEGGGGNDVIEGGEDSDNLDGGANTAVGDTLSYASAQSGVTVNLQANTTGGGAAGDVIANFENLTGSAFDDTLVGLNTGSKISAGGGNDLVVGGVAASNLDGGTGNDTIFGSDGIDTIVGGDGDDVILGSKGGDTLTGGNGLDTLSYQFGTVTGVTVTLVAGQKAIVSDGDAAGDNATLFENIIGTGANDKLTGDSGNNVIEGGVGIDILDGGGGTGDTLSYASSAAGVNVTLNLADFGLGSKNGDAESDTNKNFENLIGSADNDVLTGNTAANTIYGGDGDDKLAGGAGADQLNGGDDVDTLEFAGGVGVTVDLSKQWTVSAAGVFTGGVAGVGGEAASDKYAGFENVTGTTGNDKLTGNSAINSINGDDGDDTIEGGAGADFLLGGDGTNDTLSYSGNTEGITLFLTLFSPGFASGGHADGDFIVGFENVIGTAFGDSMIGDTGANKLSGGDGNDGINGGAGNDVLDGGKGDDFLGGDEDADTLTGGDGNDNLSGGDGIDTIFGGIGDDIVRGGTGGDTLKGETGFDTLSYAGSAIGVSVTLNGATLAAIIVATGGDADGDTATGFENVIGSNQADKLTGDAGVNVIDGGDGIDVLDGGAGIDTISFVTAGFVTVDLGLGIAITSPGTENIKNFENVLGSSDADIIIGDAQNNKVDGGGDNDTIYGGDGIDTIIGGANNDFLDTSDNIFVLLNLAQTKGADKIDGGTGDDFIGGGLGNDTLDGGIGEDRVSYLGFDVAVSVTLGAQGVETTAKAGTESDKIKNFEHAIGGFNNDTLTGNNDGNFLFGREGDDVLSGGDGNDVLVGDGDDDIYIGGKGSDTFQGSWVNGGDDVADSVSGLDTVIYARETGTGAVSVNLADNEAIDTFGDTDALFDIEIVFGSNLNDTLIGSDLAFSSTQGFGGLKGADIIDGGPDVLDNHDEVRYDRDAEFTGGTAGVIVNLTNSDIVNQTFNGKLITIGKNSAKDGFGTIDSIINIEGIRGTAQADWLFGTTDNDQGLLKGLKGADYIQGSGDDFADYSADGEHGGSGRVLVNLSNVSLALRATQITTLAVAAGKGFDGFNVANVLDTIVGLNNIQGTNSIANGTHALAINDVLVGNAGVNELRGFAGNDSLHGLDSNDILNGGDGAFDEASYIYDHLATGYTGAAIIVNLSSATAFSVASMTARDGSFSTDTLIGIEAAAGNFTNDALIGGFGANRFYGYKGADDIVGTADVGDIDGVTDLDIVDYGSDNLLGGLGAITVDLNAGTGKDGFGDIDILTDIEIVIGGKASADKLSGGNAGNFSYEGFAGLGGIDTIDGGAGFDEAIYYYDEAFGGALGITANLQLGTIRDGFNATDVVSNIEGVAGTSKVDSFTGAINAANTFRGLGGADTFNGNDTGNTGADTIDYSKDHEWGATHGIIANLTATTQIVDAALVGATGSVSVLANKVYDSFSGTTAVFDTITGTAGAGTIENVTGTQFNDIIFANGAINTIDGSGGIDTVVYGGIIDMTITLGTNGTLTGFNASGGDAAGDALKGIENLTTAGGADKLTGNNLANVLSSGVGDDFLAGLAGADTLNGGDGTDTVDYSKDGGAGSTHGVIVNLSNSTVVIGDLDAATYFGYTLGDDIFVLSGTAYDSFNNDTLIFDALISIERVVGTDYKDVIVGNDAGNRITGGLYSDTLTGGSGADGFQYNSAAEGSDTITDFQADDFLRINQAGFNITEDDGQYVGAANGVNRLMSDYFRIGTTSDAVGHGQFVYDDTTGDLFWDDDGVGGSAQVLLANLVGAPTINRDDFLLVP